MNRALGDRGFMGVGDAAYRSDREAISVFPDVIEHSPPPQHLHRSLGIVLLQGPRGALFLMSEVPLYVPADHLQ